MTDDRMCTIIRYVECVGGSVDDSCLAFCDVEICDREDHLLTIVKDGSVIRVIEVCRAG